MCFQKLWQLIHFLVEREHLFSWLRVSGNNMTIENFSKEGICASGTRPFKKYFASLFWFLYMDAGFDPLNYLFTSNIANLSLGF